MLTLIATALAAHLAAFPGQPAEGDAVLRVEGRCLYSPEVERQAEGAVLIGCGEVTLAETSVAFARRGFAEAARFEGAWNGDQFTITQVVMRGIEGARPARGSCHVLLRDERVVRLQCTAVSGPRGYIANFVVPLL